MNETTYEPSILITKIMNETKSETRPVSTAAQKESDISKPSAKLSMSISNLSDQKPLLTQQLLQPDTSLIKMQTPIINGVTDLDLGEKKKKLISISGGSALNMINAVNNQGEASGENLGGTSGGMDTQDLLLPP